MELLMEKKPRALLINVGLFEATSSVKKSKGAFSLNYQNPANNIAKVETDVEASAGFTLTALIDLSQITLIRVNGGPVQASVTLGVTAERTVPEVIELTINQFFVLDDNVQEVTIQNKGSSTVNVSITQG
jgi:hypothetical protein